MEGFSAGCGQVGAAAEARRKSVPKGVGGRRGRCRRDGSLASGLPPRRSPVPQGTGGSALAGCWRAGGGGGAVGRPVGKPPRVPPRGLGRREKPPKGPAADRPAAGTP